MKIVFFTHERAFGGASRALVTLINEIKNDNEIIVVSPFKKAKIFDYLDDKTIKISSFYSWWSIPNNASSLKKMIFRLLYKINFLSIFRLKNKLKKLNVDIIHSNTSVIDIGARIAKKINKKHVWHFREFHDNRLSFIKGNKKAYDFINKHTNKVIYVSKAIKDFYKNNIDNRLSNIVYDGIPNKFTIRKNYKNNNELLFLLLGSLEKNKGQDLVVEASKMLVDDGITDFKIIFAGNDNLNYYNYLKKKISDYNLDKNIDYIGFQKNVLALRKKCNVELMCSPMEAFGLVTVEGMMAGNLIIGSNSGGTKELIQNNITGILYKKNDITDLKNKMKYVIRNKSIIEKYGTAAKKYAINNFSSKVHAEKVLKIYNEMLGVNND